MVKFTVEDRDGTRQLLEVPDDMGLSLMETLKAFEYNILATCGGIALCATCHVKVLEGGENLPPIGDAEGQMLDTLFDVEDNSRLACQLEVNETLDGCTFKICGDEHE